MTGKQSAWARLDGRIVEFHYPPSDRGLDRHVRGLAERSFINHPSGERSKNYWVAPVTQQVIRVLVEHEVELVGITLDELIEMARVNAERAQSEPRSWLKAVSPRQLVFKFDRDSQVAQLVKARVPGARFSQRQLVWFAPMSSIEQLLDVAEELEWVVDLNVAEAIREWKQLQEGESVTHVMSHDR